MPTPLDHLFHPRNATRYRDAMQRTVDQLVGALDRVDARSTGRAATGRTPHEAATAVAAVDLDRPLGDVDTALAELRGVYLDDAVWFHEPTYAAHLNCPVVVPALLAEVLVSGVNSSLDTFDQSVGGTFVERALVEWTAHRIGFGPTADGIFTSGGTQTNLQALLLAREHARSRGVAVHRMRVLASADAHFSVEKAARLLGLEPDAVVPVRVGSDRAMDPGALNHGLGLLTDAGLVPVAVVATAGTTDFGAVDPLATVAELARAYGAWCHVDAAYGGGLLASTTRRARLSGIERADSVTVDFHKTWFQPVSASALVVADGRHLGHVTYHADYLNPHDAEHPNQVDKSLQTTRRFDALKLWLTLRVMGADAIGELVDAVVDLTDDVAAVLDLEPAVELAADPQLSTIVFRYRPEPMDEDEADALVPRIRQALYDRGLGMVAATKVGGRAWLKLTLLNPLADVDDVLGLVAQVVALGEELAAREFVA